MSHSPSLLLKQAQTRMHLEQVAKLIGQPSLATAVQDFIDSLAQQANMSKQSLEPIVKSYPDVIYHNYYALGVSLCFVPAQGGRFSPQPMPNDLKVDSIDIYNHVEREPADTIHPPDVQAIKSAASNKTPKETFNMFARLPLTVPRPSPSSSSSARSSPNDAHNADSILLDQTTLGKAIVSALGEPTKKGGGKLWLDVWLEYETLGVQIELKDWGLPVDEAEVKKHGLGGVWDRAAGWRWSCVKVFEKVGV